MKRLIPFLLAVLIVLPIAAYAQDFSLTIEDEDEYLAGKTYDLNLTIDNSGPEEWFSISLLGVPSDWMSTSTTSLKVDQGSSGTMRLILSSPKDSKPGFYSYLLTVTRPSTEAKVQRQLLVWIRQISSALVTDVELSCRQCLDSVIVSGFVDNIGTVDQELTLNVRMNDQEFTHDLGLLNVSDKISFEDTFSLADMMPDNYSIEFELKNKSGHIVFTNEEKFDLRRVKNISYVKRSSTNPFGIFVTLGATNYGNGVDTANLNSTLTKEWYTVYSGPEPSDISDNDYVWSIELNPEESTEMSYSEVYWPVIVLIIGVIIFGLISYIQLVTLSIRKRVRTRKIEKGKPISVALHIKSRMRTAESVVVKDFIPNGFKITQKFETVKPLIRKKDNGTEVVWKVGRIGKSEERILHYRITPVKDFSGKVQLPPSKIRVKYGGKPAEERSNSVVLYGKGEEPPKKILLVKVE